MSLSLNARLKCSGCGKTADVPAYGSINVKLNPELRESVKNGSIFLWECPECGSRNFVQYSTLYHDPDASLMIWLLPENENVDTDSLGALSEKLSEYTLRRVSDAGSLIEKVNIFDAGLDDAAIELCKFITKSELSEKYPDKKEMIESAPFKFYMIDGADNEITLSFPMDGSMQAVKIGFNVYEDCCGIINRNPQMRPGKGFATVDEDWVAEYLG